MKRILGIDPGLLHTGWAIIEAVQVAREEAKRSVGEIPALSFIASVIKEIPVSECVALH